MTLSRPERLIALLLLAAALGLYAGTLNYPFAWDDHAYLVENGFIKNPGHLGFLLTREYFRGTGKPRYRPVSALGYFAGYALFRLDPAGWRLGKIILHSLNAFLVYLLGKRLLRKDGGALFAALIFLCHPLAVESTVCISFNDDPLSFGFLLWALLLAPRALSGGRPLRVLLTGVIYALSLFSKETGLLFFPLLALMLGLGPRPVRTRLLPLLLWSAVTVFYLVVRLGPLAGGAMPAVTPALFPARLAFAARAGWQNLLKLAFPVGLSPDYSLPRPGWPWNLPLPALLAAGMLMLSLAAVALKRKSARFPLGWIFLSLAPASHLIPLPQPAADRYLYLPLAGLAWAAGALWAAAGRPRRTSGIFAGAILLCLAALTVARAGFWKDEQRLWADALAKAPASAAAGLNLARARLGAGETETAERLYRDGLARARDRKETAAGLLGLAEIHRRRGELGRARVLALQALDAREDSSRARILLAYLALGEGDLGEARARLEETLRRDPYAAEAMGLLGAVAAEERDWARARELMEKALDLNPDYRAGYENLRKLALRQQAEAAE